MYAVINSDNIVIATINIKPSELDLQTRNEFSVHCSDSSVGVGYSYRDGQFSPPDGENGGEVNE